MESLSCHSVFYRRQEPDPFFLLQQVMWVLLFQSTVNGALPLDMERRGDLAALREEGQSHRGVFDLALSIYSPFLCSIGYSERINQIFDKLSILQSLVH